MSSKRRGCARIGVAALAIAALAHAACARIGFGALSGTNGDGNATVDSTVGDSRSLDHGGGSDERLANVDISTVNPDLSAIRDAGEGSPDTRSLPDIASLPDTTSLPDIVHPDSADPPLLVDNRHDTCGSPFTLPGSTTSALLTIDTTGANNDYGLSCCMGTPELVIAIPASWSTLRVRCESGGARINMVLSTAVCPSGPLCADQPCRSGQSFYSYAISSGTHLVVCRDPALGPATFTINNGT